MKIQVKEQVAVTGISIDLSTQELIVLANFNDELKNVLPKDDEMSGRYSRIPTDLLVKMSVFINKIAGETQSLNQAEQELFYENVEEEVVVVEEEEEEEEEVVVVVVVVKVQPII